MAQAPANVFNIPKPPTFATMEEERRHRKQRLIKPPQQALQLPRTSSPASSGCRCHPGRSEPAS